MHATLTKSMPEAQSLIQRTKLLVQDPVAFRDPCHGVQGLPSLYCVTRFQQLQHRVSVHLTEVQGVEEGLKRFGAYSNGMSVFSCRGADR